MNTSILLLLAAMAYVAGILAPNHYHPWGAYYNDLPMLLVVTLGFLAALPLLKRLPFCVKCPVGFAALTLLAAVPLLQFCGGQIIYLGDAWVASLYLAGFGLVYGMVASLLNSGYIERKQLLFWIALVSLIAALLSGWIGLRQIFMQSGVLWEVEIPPGARPVGNLAQSNQLATLLLLGLVAINYLFLSRSIGSASVILGSFALGVMLAAVQSRSAFVAHLFYLALLFFKRKNLRSGTATTLAWGNCICVVLWLSWPWLYAEWVVQGGVSVRAVSDPFRIAIIMQMLTALKMSPWLGYGWQQVSMAQMAGAPSFPSSVMTESSHNLVLDLLVWNGLVLGAVLGVFIVVWFFRSVRVARDNEDYYAIAFMLVLLTHAMFEYPLQYAYFLLPAAAIVASIDSVYARRWLALPKICFPALFVVCLIGGLAVAWEYPAAERAMRQVRFESIGIQSSNVRSAREESDSIIVLSQLKAYVALATIQIHDGMSDFELERMRESAHRYPYKPSLMKYAFAMGVNHRFPEAKEALLSIRAIHGEMVFRSAMEEMRSLSTEYPQLSVLDVGEPSR